MSTTVNRPQHKLLSLTLVLLLATTACSQAVSSQVATPATTSTATTTASATGNSSYQLQILKNCEFVKQRQLSNDEITLYQQLKQAEQKMTALQAPLELMEQQLATQTKLLESMSAQIEQQAQQGEPDPVLLETQAELSQQISAIVDSFEPDIEAVSANGDQIGVIADQFTALLTKDTSADSYDQIRIIGPGEPATKDCNNGMFFHKSFSVKALQTKRAAD
ncbi:hypothetical protein A5320_11620 [Rheinheimera sp. SA_1]|uniref:hypothetical protein n=1 Tax=Rheinheimera sp. SA_1 TaxID=1827365 RepID=UPI0007FC8B22|nr:hypothetical protein [Rheinheimera sp. SA_1]OBP14418.1 hypothetical protein A5320_11620 [Rheinheimera sp. SA_1]